MLDTQPVHLDDNQLWQVFSYADVARILSDPATFSSDTTAFSPPQPVTTTALLGNAVLCFDRHPEAAAAVRADRDLLPAAIEEVLRFRSPFPRLARVATTDTEIGGQAIPAGQRVVPWLAAANRDAARFPDPDRFDIHRTSTGHLAFGHGIHFCIAAPLTRLEAKIVLDILLERYRDIAGTLPARSSSTTRGR